MPVFRGNLTPGEDDESNAPVPNQSVIEDLGKAFPTGTVGKPSNWTTDTSLDYLIRLAEQRGREEVINYLRSKRTPSAGQQVLPAKE